MSKRGDRKGPPLYRLALRYAILYFGFILLLELPLYLRLVKK